MATEALYISPFKTERTRKCSRLIFCVPKLLLLVLAQEFSRGSTASLSNFRMSCSLMASGLGFPRPRGDGEEVGGWNWNAGWGVTPGTHPSSRTRYSLQKYLLPLIMGGRRTLKQLERMEASLSELRAVWPRQVKINDSIKSPLKAFSEQPLLCPLPSPPPSPLYGDFIYLPALRICSHLQMKPPSFRFNLKLLVYCRRPQLIMFLRKGSQPQNINKGNKMTAFLRAVKFIFNFCFHEVFRGVFSSFPFSLRIPRRVKRGCNYCVPGTRPPPLSSTPRGPVHYPVPYWWPRLAGTPRFQRWFFLLYKLVYGMEAQESKTWVQRAACPRLESAPQGRVCVAPRTPPGPPDPAGKSPRD